MPPKQDKKHSSTSGRGRGGGGHASSPQQKKHDKAPTPAAAAAPTEPKDAKPAPAQAKRPPPRNIKQYIVGTNTELEEGIRRGTHIVASLKLSKWTKGLAFGTCPGWLPRDVALHGFEARGSSLPDDIVCIELDPQVTWKEVVERRDNQDPHVPVGYSGKNGAGVNLNSTVAPTASRIEDEADAVFEQNIERVVNHDSNGGVKKPAVRIAAECGATAPADWNPKLQPSGKIVAVFERRMNEFQACRLFGAPTDPQQVFKIYNDRYYKFKPYNEQYPIFAVLGKDIPDTFKDDIRNYLFLTEVVLTGPNQVDVPQLGGMHQARVVMSLGKGGTAEAESKAIAAAHKIRDFDFPEEVEACVMKDFIIPGPEELKEINRRDLREEEFVCTIDPATARDLDDALSITRVSGGYRVGVHIADVSHFVPLDTELDLEARARCTSTYFVERVIPMLPRRLCEDYCSLNAGTDKFAFSCIFHFDNKGQLTSEWFGQSVIRNRCRMAYGDAQKIIEGDLSGESLVFDETELQGGVTREALVKDVVSSVQLLYELAGKLRNRRYQKGALSLNKRKLRFWFEDFNSALAPKGIALDKQQEANWLIEEYMLYANIRTATKIVQFLPDCALLRRHEAPQRDKIRDFVKAAKKHGFDISASGSKALNDSLDQYRDHPNSDVLRLMATYCMSLAKYTCSGDDEETSVAHYALATPLYTHFTSPIRRYCDLIVHRQLLLALEIEQQVKLNKKNGQADKEVFVEDCHYKDYYLHPADCQAICDSANEKKEGARKAGEASMQMYFCLYLEALRLKSTVDSRIPTKQKVRAIITRVKGDKFSLYAPEIALDCEVYHNSKRQRWVEENVFDEESDTFTFNWGTHQGQEIREEKVGLFHEVEVTLEVVFYGSIKLDMLVHPPWERKGDAAMLTRFPEEL